MDRCKKRYLQNEEILTDKKYACKNQNRSGKPGCGSARFCWKKNVLDTG